MSAYDGVQFLLGEFSFCEGANCLCFITLCGVIGGAEGSTAVGDGLSNFDGPVWVNESKGCNNERITGEFFIESIYPVFGIDSVAVYEE